MSNKKHQILLLADNTHPTAAVSDHINAITKDPRLDWHVENPLRCKVLHKLDFSCFDAIGLHYSIRPHRSYYLPRLLFQKLREYQGIKFQFLQDEYQQVNVTSQCLLDLGVDLLFTLVQKPFYDRAYPMLSQIKKITILTAYVPDSLLNKCVPSIDKRTRDIFYRSRVLDYWLGSLAQEKITIASGTLERAEKYGLNVDISVREEDRIYGQKWYEMLATSKSVLATESGASVWDFDGSIEEATKNMLRNKPNASFEEVYNKILLKVDGKINYNAISPRIFEAAAFKTPLIMFPGDYNGVCLPNEHYIPLEKDFSNFEEVARKLKDNDYLAELAERAYNDLILSRQYSEDKLSELVCDEILQSISKQPQHNMHIIVKTIQNKKKKHALLNYYYLWKTEIIFIAKNVFGILFDSRHEPLKKPIVLFKGAQRYFLYLFSRLFTKI